MIIPVNELIINIMKKKQEIKKTLREEPLEKPSDEIQIVEVKDDKGHTHQLVYLFQYEKLHNNIVSLMEGLEKTRTEQAAVGEEIKKLYGMIKGNETQEQLNEQYIRINSRYNDLCKFLGIFEDLEKLKEENEDLLIMMQKQTARLDPKIQKKLNKLRKTHGTVLGNMFDSENSLKD
jgi:hypothetical protein